MSNDAYSKLLSELKYINTTPAEKLAAENGYDLEGYESVDLLTQLVEAESTRIKTANDLRDGYITEEVLKTASESEDAEETEEVAETKTEATNEASENTVEEEKEASDAAIPVFGKEASYWYASGPNEVIEACRDGFSEVLEKHNDDFLTAVDTVITGVSNLAE